MAKERLSKLQKWILKRAKNNMIKCCEKGGTETGRPHIYRTEIYSDYYKCGGDLRDVPQKFRVSVSRSLKGLGEKRLIELIAPKGCLILYSHAYCEFIMEEYRKKKALNVNEVN